MTDRVIDPRDFAATPAVQRTSTAAALKELGAAAGKKRAKLYKVDKDGKEIVTGELEHGDLLIAVAKRAEVERPPNTRKCADCLLYVIRKRFGVWKKRCAKCAKEHTLELERERQRKRRAANPEKIRERQRERHVANPEKIRERQRKRYAANPERYREYRRKYREKIRECERKRRAANPEKRREKDRERYAADPEKARELRRKYYAANLEKMREQRRECDRKRRAAKKAEKKT